MNSIIGKCKWTVKILNRFTTHHGFFNSFLKRAGNLTFGHNKATSSWLCFHMMLVCGICDQRYGCRASFCQLPKSDYILVFCARAVIEERKSSDWFFWPATASHIHMPFVGSSGTLLEKESTRYKLTHGQRADKVIFCAQCIIFWS